MTSRNWIVSSFAATFMAILGAARPAAGQESITLYAVLEDWRPDVVNQDLGTFAGVGATGTFPIGDSDRLVWQGGASWNFVTFDDIDRGNYLEMSLAALLHPTSWESPLQPYGGVGFGCIMSGPAPSSGSGATGAAFVGRCGPAFVGGLSLLMSSGRGLDLQGQYYWLDGGPRSAASAGVRFVL